MLPYRKKTWVTFIFRVYVNTHMTLQAFCHTDNIMSACINPLTAKLFNLNFHPLEVVSRWRDPQLQVSEKYSDLTKCRSNIADWCHILSFTCLKCGT